MCIGGLKSEIDLERVCLGLVGVVVGFTPRLDARLLEGGALGETSTGRGRVETSRILEAVGDSIVLMRSARCSHDTWAWWRRNVLGCSTAQQRISFHALLYDDGRCEAELSLADRSYPRDLSRLHVNTN